MGEDFEKGGVEEGGVELAGVHGAVEGWVGGRRVGGGWGGGRVVAAVELEVIWNVGHVWLGEEELAFDGGIGVDRVVEGGGYARQGENVQHGKVAEDELDELGDCKDAGGRVQWLLVVHD